VPALFVASSATSWGRRPFVTDQNLQRAIHPELVPAGGFTGLDLDYIRRIGGADTVPGLIATRSQLSPADLAIVDTILQRRANELERDAAAGWPSWNLARTRALDALTQPQVSSGSRIAGRRSRLITASATGLGWPLATGPRCAVSRPIGSLLVSTRRGGPASSRGEYGSERSTAI
jgi:hypothetical protein